MGQQDEELMEFTKQLGKIRADSPALKEGTLEFPETPADTLAVLRTDGTHSFLAVINTLDAEISLPLDPAHASFTPVMGEVYAGILRLKPYGYAILTK